MIIRIQMCKKIKKTGCNVLLVQKSILRDAVNELSLHFLSKLKIMVISDIERDEIDFISRVFSIFLFLMNHRLQVVVLLLILIVLLLISQVVLNQLKKLILKVRRLPRLQVLLILVIQLHSYYVVVIVLYNSFILFLLFYRFQMKVIVLYMMLYVWFVVL